MAEVEGLEQGEGGNFWRDSAREEIPAETKEAETGEAGNGGGNWAGDPAGDEGELREGREAAESRVEAAR